MILNQFQIKTMVEEENKNAALNDLNGGDADDVDEKVNGIPDDQLEAIDDMLMKLLAANPDLTPDQLTPEMLASFAEMENQPKDEDIGVDKELS